MSEIDQGGVVYPQVTHEFGEEMHHIGITLRQYYAGLAMQALISAGVYVGCDEDDIAKKAFCYADAMIEAGQ